jgi:hypothetical protein
MHFLAVSDCLGLCLGGWWIYLRVRGREVILEVLLFGKWSLFALCGVYGMNKMGDTLRILKGIWRGFCSFSLLLFSLGQQPS